MMIAAMTGQIERPSLDDGGLTAALARGDEGAFEQMVALYQQRVTRLAYRLMGWRADVDDIVQDVFLAALRSSDRFRGDCSLWSWLTAVTLNRCRTIQRRQKVWGRIESVLGRRRERMADPADAGVASQEVAREVRSAVAGLPPRDREVIVLFYLEHRSVAQMSEAMACSTNAIEVRLHRARAKLRVTLGAFMKE